MSDDQLKIVKSNALIQAAYRLTLGETRIILAAIAQVRRDGTPTDEEMYEVRANALADISGIAAKKAYDQLQAAAEKLETRRVRFFSGPNHETQPRVRSTGWVQTVEYIPGEGRIMLRFSKDILPYLSQIKNQYTRYNLENVASMRSTFGIRLYELLQQWRQKGEREIDQDDLRRMFGVPEDSYKALKDLKKRVIEPAVRDVNECSDLSVTWGQRKVGRRVTAIQFGFHPKHEEKPKKSKDLTKKEIERLAKPGETWEQAQQRLKKAEA